MMTELQALKSVEAKLLISDPGNNLAAVQARIAVLES